MGKAMKDIELWNGDCLDLMENIPEGCIDMVLTDPPYGTTGCKWDSVVPFGPMWEHLERMAKPNAAICLFGSEPFASTLRTSNIKKFKYDWIWKKTIASNFASARKQPLNRHEYIMVFYHKLPCYTPQMVKGIPYRRTSSKERAGEVFQTFGKTEIQNIRGDR